MTRSSEVAVTLSETLLGYMRFRAAALNVPLEWLVAGLVCDTLENCIGMRPTSPASTPDVGRTRSRPASALA